MPKAIKKLSDLIGFKSFLIAVLVLTGSLQFALMQGNVTGDTYDFQVTTLASETIRSAKTLEDTVKTEQDREQAASKIEPVYQFSEEVASNRASIVKSLFDYVIEVKNTGNQDSSVPSQEQINSLHKKLDAFDGEQFALELTDDELKLLLMQTENDLIDIRDKLAKQVETYLNKPMRKDNLAVAKNEFESKVRQETDRQQTLLNILVRVARASIVETEIINQTLTDTRIAQAKESVEPTRILQGQIIVQEGEMIDREVYRQLELLGMLKSTASKMPIAGLAILIVLQMSFLYVLFARWEENGQKKRNSLLVTTIVYSLTIILMKITSIIAGNFDVMVAYIFPTALATMLIRLLANERVAILVTVMTGASAGVIFQQGYSSVLQMDIALYIIFGGFASLFFMHSMEKRAHILQACGVVSIVNLCFISFYLLTTQSGYVFSELAFYIGAGILSGFISGALTMGLLPFLESAFGLLSTMRLIELSNPNHPLLKKLLIETPGTYHHSVMVANLAEAACEAVGADGLLARVACYYHDVGKTKRPNFFIENQMSGINPHDAMEPEKSAQVIISHTTDGAALLEKHKMPQEIIDIALQHHGTSLIKFFLHKAKEEGKELDEVNFRYPGPKPRTKEAAVISIADSVEAAVRSMKEPNVEKIKSLVRSIIKDRISDNQFDECDISIKELKTVEKVLCETLNGIFHSRIEYPEADKAKEEKNDFKH